MRHPDRCAVISMLSVSVLLAAGCTSVRASYETGAPSPIEADSARLTARTSVFATASPIARDARDIVLIDAEQLIGTPYRYGGSSPADGFDCSGFVQWVFSRQGIDLPRTARAMSKAGVRVPARRTSLLPGDLLFFAEKGGAVSHVAIYAGDGRIIHASSGQGAVRYEDLDSARGEWFRRHIIVARRVMGQDTSSLFDARSSK